MASVRQPTAPSTTTPFTLLYANAQHLRPDEFTAWSYKLCSPPSPSSSSSSSPPPLPQLFAFVEAGNCGVHTPPPGWESRHLPGPEGGAGGITLFFHHCAVRTVRELHPIPRPANRPSHSNSTSALIVEVAPNHRDPFLLATCYLPPQCARTGCPTNYIEQITLAISSARALYPRHPLVVVGDFNCRNAAWGDDPSPYVPAASTFLAGWIEDEALDLLNPPSAITRPTHSNAPRDPSSPVTGTIIDLVLCSHYHLLSSISQDSTYAPRSDHLPFLVQLALPSHQPGDRPPVDRTRTAWDVHCAVEAWQAALPVALTAALQPLQRSLRGLRDDSLAGSTPQQALDTTYTLFETILRSTCEQVVGTREVTSHPNPFLTFPGVAAAHRARSAAYKRHKSFPTPASLTLRDAADARWRAVRQQALQQLSSDLCTKVMEPGMSKLAWTAFKRTAPSTFSPLSSIPHPDTGQLPVDRPSSLDNLCTSFIRNGTPPPVAAADQPDYDAQTAAVAALATPAPLPPSSNPPAAGPLDTWSITTDMVEAQCTHQHTDTAPGPDTILPIFLKHAGRAAWEAMATLFAFSWRHAITPQAWREANVMALYKGGGGDKSSADSYRPISMTSIVIRTFEHLIHNQLADFLDPAQPHPSPSARLGPYQFGFRRQHATTDAIHYLYSSIQSVITQKTSAATRKATLQAPVLFLDIAKAFDRVDHTILLHRLHQRGIRGKAWLWLRSFLSHRRMRTIDDAHYSSWQQVEYGVPQGCVLSPILFLVFIDGLQHQIHSTCLLLAPLFFADDGAIGPRHDWHKHSTIDAFTDTYRKQMVRAIGHLQRWCDTSRMSFGAKKTQLVIFSGRQKGPDRSNYEDSQALRLCGFSIAIAPSYRYLGLHLHQHQLSWTAHFQHVLANARQAAARVARVALHAGKHMNLQSVRTLVTSYLIPSFSYGILFWGRHLTPDNHHALHRCLALPLRCALSLPSTSHVLSVLEMCHIPTVDALTLQAQLAHQLRVGRLPANHPTKVLHDFHLNQALKKRQEPQLLLQPDYGIPTAVHTATCVLPVVCYDRSLTPLLPDHHRLNIPDLPHGCAPNQFYWSLKGSDRLEHSRTVYHLHHSLKELSWSRTALGGFKPATVRSLRDLAAHAAWKRQHYVPTPPLPPDAPVPDKAPKHSTNNPLTRAKALPGLSPYLSPHSPDSHTQRVRRARLLLGRSYTGTVRKQFHKGPAPAPADLDICTHAQCHQRQLRDSIDHMLLTCPRHRHARQQLTTQLQPLHSPTTPLLPLTLATILCSSPTDAPRALVEPERQRADSGPVQHLRHLIRITSTFLDRVAEDRAAAGLPHLDTG